MDFIKNLPFIKKIYREKIHINEPFEIIASKFADIPGTVVLLSGGDFDCARYNILATMPWLTITGKNESIVIQYKNKKTSLKTDPFNAVNDIINHFDISDDPCASDGTLPVNAGLFGYFAYDLKNSIEKLPKTCIDQNLPDIVLYSPSIILVQDKWKNLSFLCIPVIENKKDKKSSIKNFNGIRNLFFDKLNKKLSMNFSSGFSINTSGFRSNFTKQEYIESVKKIIEYIKAGDIYQVNLSQRFEAKFKGSCYSLFLKLFQKNPAPFFAFINADDHFILSTSPERFIKRDGYKIETRPIKGTIARGKTEKEDKKQEEKLLNSSKDDAELSMIVDLMRNDLGKVAKSGSVRVKEHKRLEAYDNVFHLVSIVEAVLEKNKTSVDILRATFPGGSITGCPKVRTMEIIDELEPVSRHVYTGSIGYLSFHNTLDLSIVIRTAIVSDGIIGFSVGGGIVYDSIPQKEFKETLDKGKTFLDTLTPVKKFHLKKQEKKVWVNGKIINEKNALISATSTGFQYGAGIFETIKVKKGVPLYLNEHIKRFNSGLKYFFNTDPPDYDWHAIIDLVISENHLKNEISSVKIIVAEQGGRIIRGKKSIFLAVFAKPYIHRLEISGKKGIELITYPYSRQTPLADYKTLNYMYYYLAMKYAKQNNADEALILNPDGTVSETNTCNIIAINSKKIVIPVSSHFLNGITLNEAIKILSEKGYEIVKKKINPINFFMSEQIILTNSLMGAVPVISLDKKKFNPLKISNTIKICDIINT